MHVPPGVAVHKRDMSIAVRPHDFSVGERVRQHLDAKVCIVTDCKAARVYCIDVVCPEGGMCRRL